MRTFLSLIPDSETCKKVLEFQNEVKDFISKENKKFYDLLKWETEDKFHLTLFFLGEIDEDKVEEVDNKLSVIEDRVKLGKIDFKFNGIDAFPKLRFSRILILDLLNEDNKAFVVAEMIKDLMVSAGFKADKNFRPHITLARVKRDHNLNFTNLKDKFKMKHTFTLNKFYLMQSELKATGSEYFILKEYSFG